MTRWKRRYGFSTKSRSSLLSVTNISDKWPSNMLLQQYDQKWKDWPVPMVALTDLIEEQKKRPRNVYEDPKLWAFQSTNFDLLLRIYAQG